MKESELESSVRRVIESWSKQQGVTVAVHCNGLVGHRFSKAVQVAVGELVEEGLRNVAEHAAAHSASVYLRRSGESLRVLVEDDGIGFAVGRRARGAGLQKIQEIALGVGGSMLLESRRGQGTSVGMEVRV